MDIRLTWEEQTHSPAELRARAAEAQRIKESHVFQDAIRIATVSLMHTMVNGEDSEVLNARAAFHGLECVQIGLDAIIADGVVAEES